MRAEKILLGEPENALGTYLSIIAWLLRIWRNDPPPSGLSGDATAHWCDRHPDILQLIQGAMCSRSSYFSPEEIEWTREELRPGGRAHSKDNVKLGLVPTTRFTGQRTWRQAARTAAYSLFGAFLGDKPEIIGFCRRCEKPFFRGKSTVFCFAKCALLYSAKESRDRKTRKQKRNTFNIVARELRRWLSRHHRAGSVWWKDVQDKADINARRSSRKSRTISKYIRAAISPSGSLERMRLLSSLFHEGDFADSARRHQELETLKQELETFLTNVQRAENLAMRGKRK